MTRLIHHLLSVMLFAVTAGCGTGSHTPSAASPGLGLELRPGSVAVSRADRTEVKRSDQFPDIALTDQFGKSHRFRSELVNEKLCCIAFFYTQCEGSCPQTMGTMIELRKQLVSLFPAQAVQFLAITLDPEHDSSEVLLEYARWSGIEPNPNLCSWLLCTGDYDEIDALRIELGLYELDPVLDADRTNHAGLIVFGNDRTDRWSALPAGLPIDHLVEAIRRIGGDSIEQKFAHLEALVAENQMGR